MICLDTCVLIWGVQGAANEQQEGMIERTTRYIKSLREGNTPVMIPSPVVAEYLQGFRSMEERAKQLRALKGVFFIPSFDLRAAALAADLSQSRQSPTVTGPGSRQYMKVDIQIIATAIASGAKKIVTGPGEAETFRRISDGRIPVTEVPIVEEQGQLFDESRAGEAPDGDGDG